MLIKKSEQVNQAVHQYSKTQKFLLGKCILTAGIGFALICLIGYGFYYALINQAIEANTLYTIGSVGIVLSFVMMIMFSFMQASFFKYLILYPIYIISSGIGFSSLFITFDGGELLMIFGIAGISMVLCGLLALVLPQKIIGSLMKFGMLMIGMIFLMSLIFSLVSIFSFNSYGDQWWSIIVVVGFGIFSVIYNIYLLHILSKTSQFSLEMDNKTAWLFVLGNGFVLLVSFVQLVWTIASMYLRFK